MNTSYTEFFMARIRRKITRTGAKPSKKTKKIILTDQEKAKRRAEDEQLAQQLKNVVSYIIAPAGSPPYDLEGDDFESVRDWVSKIKTSGNHSVQSCQYWVKYFYDPFQQKEQWKAVRSLIKENHQEFGIPDIPAPKVKYDKVENQGW